MAWRHQSRSRLLPHEGQLGPSYHCRGRLGTEPVKGVQRIRDPAVAYGMIGLFL